MCPHCNGSGRVGVLWHKCDDCLGTGRQLTAEEREDLRIQECERRDYEYVYGEEGAP